jgi:hypothetical protein
VFSPPPRPGGKRIDGEPPEIAVALVKELKELQVL